MADNDSDFDMDFTTHRYPNRWNEDNWEKEMEEHPIFMTEQPKDGQLPPMLEALQQIKYDPSEMTTEELVNLHKQDGNQAFKVKNYRQAVACYSEAIKQKCTNKELMSILHANRAAAHFYLFNNRSALSDAMAALEFNDKNTKALDRALECFKRLNRFKELLEFCDQYSYVNPERFQMIRKQAEEDLKKQQRDERRRQTNERKLDMNRKLEQERVEKLLRKKGIMYTSKAVDYHNMEGHPVNIHIGPEGALLFPTIFFYPEYGVSDYIEQMSEYHCLFDHFVEMFEKESPAWDVNKKYKPNTMCAVYQCEFSKKIYTINVNNPIGLELKKQKITIHRPALGFLIGTDLDQLITLIK